jgi:hypothetical protein
VQPGEPDQPDQPADPTGQLGTGCSNGVSLTGAAVVGLAMAGGVAAAAGTALRRGAGAAAALAQASPGGDALAAYLSATTTAATATAPVAVPAGAGATAVQAVAAALGQGVKAPAGLTDAIRQVRYEQASLRGRGNPALQQPAPNTAYVVNNAFLYLTDGAGRVAYMQGRLQPGGSGHRYGRAQSRSGGIFRLPGDQGSHFAGTDFGGPGEGLNLAPWSRMLNGAGRANFWALERHWAGILNASASNHVDIRIEQLFAPPPATPNPVGVVPSQRPLGIRVTYSVAGGPWQNQYLTNPPPNDPALLSPPPPSTTTYATNPAVPGSLTELPGEQP